MSGPTSERFLVADVGGTNARFAVAERSAFGDESRLQLLEPRSLAVAQYGRFDDAIAHYLETAGLATMSVGGACLAVASAVGAGEIRFTNSPWRFSREALIDRFNFQRLLIINDFEALALQVTSGPPDLVRLCRAGEEHPRAARVVVGPGTGLGVAGLVRATNSSDEMCWQVVPGEGGHVGFAPTNELEMELLVYLRKQYGRVSIERVASGAGLSACYCFLRARAGLSIDDKSPESIAGRALAGSDPVAREAVKLFLAVTGGFAGDVALTFGALGGVYLGGGILPRLLPLLPASDFFLRFDDKGRHADWVRKIPVHMIVDDRAALFGAAAALLRS